MTIEQICEFVTLAEQRNYLIAADIMYMTQATLSRHIMSLEEELGFSLFDRTTKRIELTTEGTHFLVFARDVVKLKESYEFALKKAKTQKEGILRVSYNYMVSLYNVNIVLTNFIAENPNKKIAISEGEPKQLIQNVEGGLCDIAIFQEDPFDRVHGIDLIRLHTDTLILIVSRKNPLSLKKELTLSDIKDQKFVTSSPDKQPVCIMFEACRRAGFEPNIAKTGFTGASTFEWIDANPDYVALEWKGHAMVYSSDKFALINVLPELYYHTVLVYNKESLPPLGRQLIKYLQKTI